jgi:hypothetical protein
MIRKKCCYNFFITSSSFSSIIILYCKSVCLLCAKKFYDDRYFCNANLYTINEINIHKFLELNERDHLDWLIDQRIEILECWKDSIKKSLLKVISVTVSVLSRLNICDAEFFFSNCCNNLCAFSSSFLCTKESAQTNLYSHSCSMCLLSIIFLSFHCRFSTNAASRWLRIRLEADKLVIKA